MNTDIVYTPTKEMKDKKKGFPIYTRKLTCVIPITGVPFCKSSAMEKTMLIKRPQPGKLTWEMVTNVFDVPYGDHFEHHETWTLLSTSDTAVKSILRAADKLKMKKSTFFEGSIRSRSKEEFIAYFAKWMAAIEEKGYMVQKEEVLKILIPKKVVHHRRRDS